MCSREKNSTLFDGPGTIEKSQTSTISLWILNMVIPPIVPTYLCLSPVLVIVIWIPWFVRWEMRNERRILLLGIRSYSLSPLFTENGEINFSIHRILGRDWRDSNPQLPPWQGGALTDWTTIPGKLGVQPKIFFFLSFEPFISFRRVVTETRMIY